MAAVKETPRGRKDADSGLGAEAQAWIEAVLQAPLGEGTLHEVLKDGTHLCSLVNAIKPGTIKKFNQHPKMPFKAMENIGLYCAACKELGVPGHDMFSTVDLYEENNMAQVVINLNALGRAAQKIPEFAGPHFGGKAATPNKREFTEEQLQRGKNEQTLMGKGSHGGATQSGVFDHSRDIVRGAQ